MSMKRRINKNNRGFSLVEVIVSILIASIIVLAISSLMTVGTRVFHTTNTETEMQKESQIAMNQISNIMMKAVSYSYYEDIVISTGETVSVLLIKTDREESDGSLIKNNYYAIIVDTSHDELLFQKITDYDMVSLPSPHNTVRGWVEYIANNEIRVTTERSLLSRYIDSFQVTPTETPSTDENIAQITIGLALDGKTYSTFSNVSLRNN